MNIISWTRLCYVLLAGPELEEFLLDLAVKSAAASRCDKSVGEAYLELRREIGERPLILCTCSDSVLATLRCPHCGARLVRDGIHFRHAEEAEFVIRGQLGLDCGIGEDGRAIFAIPRLKCTAKRACVRNFSPDCQAECADGATHLLIPSFLGPYQMLPIDLACDLARAQRALDATGRGSLRGTGIWRCSGSAGTLSMLAAKYGDMWLHLCDTYLNRARGRRLVRYMERLRSMYAACYVEAHMNCVRARAAQSPRGDLRHRRYAPPRRVPSPGSCLAVLSSCHGRRSSSYPEWPPPSFWRNLRTEGGIPPP